MPASGADSLKPSAFIPVCTAACLLVGSTSMFFVFTCPWLAVTICPAVPPCCAVLFLFVLANFTMATFMDAGVLPVAGEDEDKEDEFRAPLYKNVEVKGVQVRMKWCASCHFYRPPRCSHCSVCDRCVEDFDHHCPWVNNCIGRRNYRYFFLFLLSLTVHMVAVFTFGLIYVLHHMDDLWKLHCLVTLVVISISGLFLIPVLGLTGFHLYLVSRGRTTNEQVTGKFQGGINPFTRGCCSNMEYLVCSPLSPTYETFLSCPVCIFVTGPVPHSPSSLVSVSVSRQTSYTSRPCQKTAVHVRPPFLRPEVDRQMPGKVRGNGIQTLATQNKQSSAGAVELSDIKQLRNPPPLPPKPDRGLLKSQVAVMDDVGHYTKSIIPVSIPTVPQLRPVLEAISRGSSPIPPEQLLKASEQQVTGKGPDLCSDSRESPVRGGVSVQAALQPCTVSSSLQLNSLTLSSRGLTLKHGSRNGSKTQLLSMNPDGLGSNSPAGILTGSSLLAGQCSSGGGGSNKPSYDSLVNPADPQLMAHRGAPAVSYHTHFMALGSDGVVQRPPPHSYSPVFMGVARQSPQPRESASRDPSPSLPGFLQRDSSPAYHGLITRDVQSQSVASRDVPPPGLVMRDVTSQGLQDNLRDLYPHDATLPMSAAARYDNFSKTIMASIQERREQEERERMVRVGARSQVLYGPDVGIYDIPSRRSLPPDNGRPPGSRGPTPPAYGSREFLMSTGILGYGMRTSPLSCSSTSSLTRGPKTSSSPLQSSSSSLQSKGRSSSPAYCPAERHAQAPPSTTTLPRLASSAYPAPPYTSYATAKRSSLPFPSEGKESVTLGALK